jgi:hypothetical protein
MGITIHYSGRASSKAAAQKVMDRAQLFAAQRGWMFAMFDDPMGDEEARDPAKPWEGDFDPDSPTRGIVIRTHPKCEPIRIVFNARNELKAWTKTAYAPFSIHVEIIKLLREIAPLLEDFEVLDEVNLWETGDEAAARARFGARTPEGEVLTDEEAFG